VATDAGCGRRDDPSGVNDSYGVIWRENGGALGRGKLELLARSLRLDGITASRSIVREVPYDELAGVRVGRAKADRLAGRPTVVLQERSGGTIFVASVSEPGVIGELAERLTVLRAGRRTAVVLPLQPGAEPAVRALLAEGPPFDPDAIGLDRHEVYLTPTEAVFVFESRLGANVLEPLLAEPGLWDTAAAWREQLAGPPRIAESVYSWQRMPAGDPSLLPPGLRN
jgi:hypothetical protein